MSRRRRRTVTTLHSTTFLRSAVLDLYRGHVQESIYASRKPQLRCIHSTRTYTHTHICITKRWEIGPRLSSSIHGRTVSYYGEKCFVDQRRTPVSRIVREGRKTSVSVRSPSARREVFSCFGYSVVGGGDGGVKQPTRSAAGRSRGRRRPAAVTAGTGPTKRNVRRGRGRRERDGARRTPPHPPVTLHTFNRQDRRPRTINKVRNRIYKKKNTHHVPYCPVRVPTSGRISALVRPPFVARTEWKYLRGRRTCDSVNVRPVFGNFYGLTAPDGRPVRAGRNFPAGTIK